MTAVNPDRLPTWQVLDRFAAEIAAAGLGHPEIIADGAIHRFRTLDDKAGQRSGWYCLHLDRLPAGVFGCWKLGLTQTWCAKEREEMSRRERADFAALIEQAKRQQQAERERQWQQAAERAVSLWSQTQPAPVDHPYLIDKQIGPHVARIDRRGWLVIPVGDESRLWSLQFIAPDGGKRFLPGGRISGAWCPLPGVKESPILIGEGFATVASLVEETGAPGIVAFNAGNLLPVAKSIRRLNPRAEIVVCGDDDRWTEGNPGRTKARQAAVTIGAKLLLPDFNGLDLSAKPTDFNDLYRLRRQAAREVFA